MGRMRWNDDTKTRTQSLDCCSAYFVFDYVSNELCVICMHFYLYIGKSLQMKQRDH